MFHPIVFLRRAGDTCLYVAFADGEIRLYDMQALIDAHPAFSPLRDESLFSCVSVDAGGYGVSWNDDIDLSAEEIYENGVHVHVAQIDCRRIAREVAEARKAEGLSQKQLEVVSGVRQPAIARLEGGSTVPRLDTVLKVLAPLGKTLAVVDVDETEALERARTA